MEAFPEMNERFETWLQTYVPLDPKDLEYKHRKMADRRWRFPFFRATYFRWLSQWPEACSELVKAPIVLAVGDLHVENFGTWRDAEGRLTWGVNDFDECESQPYTQDLVRLAASAILAIREGALQTPANGICASILKGYARNLKRGGLPFVLNGPHSFLRGLALSHPRDPVKFWRKERKATKKNAEQFQGEAHELLHSSLPAHTDGVHEYRRRKVGMGSLGKPRLGLIAAWRGGRIGREVKARTPPAGVFVRGAADAQLDNYRRIVASAQRLPDPYLRIEKAWILRRLAPDCAKIELSALATVDEVSKLLVAMGVETANIHLGTRATAEAILANLSRRPNNWLRDAARRMVKLVASDWKSWRDSLD